MVAKVKKPAFQAPIDAETGLPAEVKTQGWGLDGQLAPAPETPPAEETEEPPKEGDHGVDADGKASVYTNGQWVLAEEEVAGPTPTAEAKPKPSRKKKSDVAPDPDPPVLVNDQMSADLIAFAEKIERGNEEVEAAQSDVKEFYAEAKGKGYSPKILREVIRRRAMDAAEREEHDTQLQIYEDAINRGTKDEDE